MMEERYEREYFFTREELGKEVFDAIHTDNDYKTMCAFMVSVPEMLAKKIKQTLPEEGPFKQAGICFDSPLKCWEEMEIFLFDKPGSAPDYQHGLSIIIPIRSNGMTVTTYLFSGTRDEAMEYLLRPEFPFEFLREVARMEEKVSDYRSGIR